MLRKPSLQQVNGMSSTRITRLGLAAALILSRRDVPKTEVHVWTPCISRWIPPPIRSPKSFAASG